MNWKKIMILWCVAVATYSLCAMERDFMDVDDSNTRCYIAELPFDLLSLLSEYIIESDKEFLERSKLAKKFNELPHQYYRMCLPQIRKYGTIMSNWCWKCLMLAILEYGEAADHTPVGNAQLTIINTQKNAVCYTGDLEKQKYKGVAISQDGNLFATIHERLNNNEAEIVLTIQDIITKQKQCAIIPNDLDNSHSRNVHIDFNVQETKIVLCEELFPKKWLQEPSSIKREKIIPITIKTTSNSITPLGVYFARNVICKNLLKQLEYHKNKI